MLWYTDRSRYETGLGYCSRARALEYHLGPSGYGIRAKAQALPQVRGIFTHLGTGALLETLKATNQEPSDEQTRAAVTLAVDKYTSIIEARGLRQLDHGDRLETIIKEQTSLLTGLIWTFRLEILPWLHAEYRIVDVEREEIAVLGCTCGLGDLIGTAADHEARDCNGIAWMSRADAIGESRTAPGTYVYLEQKTAGQGGEMFETQWETKIQFAAGVLGAEQRLGVPIDQSLVLTMFTGRREASYNYETGQKDGPLIQQSPFCYGYCKPAPAPGMVDEWAAQYNYTDEQGRKRRLGKGFEKRAVWELDPRLCAGLAPAEYWARWLPPEVRRQQVLVIGPLNKQRAVIEGWMDEVVEHEREWQGRVWEAYSVAQELTQDTRVGEEFDDVWHHHEYQHALNKLFPRSWQCRRYGKRHECQFADLCHLREGWDRPLGNGQYMLRRPHHQPEIDQATARGIELPVDEGEEQED